MEQRWRRSLDIHVRPKLGHLLVSEIHTADVLKLLKSLRERLPKSVPRVRQQISAVLSWAVGLGYRTDDPCGAALDALMPEKAPASENHLALPFGQVSAALDRVRGSDHWIGARLLLEFIVLTAVRTNEARGALWSEIDWAALEPRPRDVADDCSPHRVLPPCIYVCRPSVWPICRWLRSLTIAGADPLPADNAPALNLRSVSSECTVQACRPLSSSGTRVECLPIRIVTQVILVTGELSARSSVLKPGRHEHLVWLARTQRRRHSTHPRWIGLCVVHDHRGRSGHCRLPWRELRPSRLSQR